MLLISSFQYNADTDQTTENCVGGRSSRTNSTRSKDHPSARIVGGKGHNIKEFPFFASLTSEYAICGGTLITKAYVLSVRVHLKLLINHKLRLK